MKDDKESTVAVKIPEAKLKEYIEIERKMHSWADDATLRLLVEDELKADPGFYEKLEGETEEDEEEDDNEDD